MNLASIFKRYQDEFQNRYGAMLSSEQRDAFNAIIHCRTEYSGQLLLSCDQCGHTEKRPHSCGNRSCPTCQHHDAKNWVDNKMSKLLPVNYFMVTFTLPSELRLLVLRNQRDCYQKLVSVAVQTLQSFSENDDKLGGHLGLITVLHTHSRRLDYHPHLHVVVPAGCFKKKEQQWVSHKGGYLFNGFALGKVFRARFLDALRQLGLKSPPTKVKKWVVDCKEVGNGAHALKYLSRYLYRGVVSEKNIIKDDGRSVTFRYTESETKSTKTRTLPGVEFIRLILMHVLPSRFRRCREYGYLHGNCKIILKRIQLLLKTIVPNRVILSKVRPLCPTCKEPMKIVAHIRRSWRSG